MRTTLLLSSLVSVFFLVMPGGVQAQDDQPADCGTCTCTLDASNLDPIVANPCVSGTQNIPWISNRTYRRMTTTIGAVYRVSLCAVPGAPVNTVMHIRENTGSFLPVIGACDDDGCGITGGYSSVQFVATQTSHRVYIYVGSCSAATHFLSTATVRYQCISGTVPIPPNDEPCGAVALPVVSTSCSGAVSGTTVGATGTAVAGLGAGGLNPNGTTPAGNPCLLAGYANSDVWYSITIPPIPFNGMIGINTSESSLCAGALGLYTAPNCAAGPYTWLNGTGLCSIDGLNAPNDAPGIVFDPFAYGLTNGQTIYVRYWERNANENGGFTICAYEAVPPANDAPCGAIVLPTPPVCAPVEYNTENAQPMPPPGVTVPVPSCGNPGIPIRDMWFRVTVPAGGMTVTTSPGTLTNMAMAWYRLTGACGTGSMTQIGCNDNVSAANLMPRINSATAGIVLTTGETIYIRVWNRPATQANYWGTFSICVTPNNPPPNDDPCGAIPLVVGVDCIMGPTTNVNASNTVSPFAPGAGTVAVPSCGAPASGDIWFTVDVPSDLVAPFGLRFDADTAGSALALDLAIAVYRDTSQFGCADHLALEQVPGGCSVSNGANTARAALLLNVPTITPGERLYVRVWRQTTVMSPFSICAERTDIPPCVGTYYDTGGPSGNYQNFENYTMVPFCPSKAGDVVTLTFTQFAVEQGFDFLYIYNGDQITDPLIGVWTGNSSPGTVTATLAGDGTGCLTVRYTSDFIIVGAGFTFKVSCSPPLPPPPPSNCVPAVTSPTPFGWPDGVSYDPGGPSAPYANNIGQAGNPIHTQVICPQNAGDVVTLTFNSFNVEGFWDALFLWNAPNLAAANPGNMFNSGGGPCFVEIANPVPVHFTGWGSGGGYNGAGTIGPFTSTLATNPSGCITMAFVTDASVTPPGWSATAFCGAPPPPDPPPVGDCGVVFYETPGGSTGNYANNVTSTQTYCAPAGQLLTVTFQQFALENNWDKMYVFDGPSTASPMIPSGNGVGFGPAPFGAGSYWGFAAPGPFTTSTPGGCLTFYFVTDASVVFTGWRARTSCAPPLSNDDPCVPTGATLLTVQTSCVPQTFTNVGATTSSTTPAPACGNYSGRDVWFRFVAPPNGRVFIDSRAGTLLDGAMTLYSAASCAGPFTAIECDDDDGPGLMPAIDRMCNTLVPGATYWIRFYGFGGTRGTFDLCLSTSGYTTTLQSDCGGAFSLCSAATFSGNSSPGPGCSNDLTNVNLGCLSGGERRGSWYAFRVQNAGTLGMTITPSVAADVDWAIWQGSNGLPNPVDASCVPGAAPIRCSFASLYNTQTVGGSNSGALTGMGRATFAGGFVYANPTPAVPANTDAVDGWVQGVNVAANEVYILFVDDHHLAGRSYSVAWNATPTVAGNPVIDCAILPVEELQLQAAPQERTVDLVWSTVSERNSSYFTLERSADGVGFEAIGTVPASGHTNGTTDYPFTDVKPLRGMNYYRVQQIDHNGSVEVSNVVYALFEPDEVKIMVVPNPARNSAEVVLSTAYEGTLHVRVVDGSGRLVATQQTMTGVQRFELPIEKMEAGSYVVHLFTENGTPYARTRFVKQ